jgi:hypothetical protein
MARASVRLLTQGWSSDQRRALVNILDERQVTLVRRRIELDCMINDYEKHEADEAIQFLITRGANGYASWGIVEYTAVALFGRDPVFRDRWQEIRRMT